jgi:CRISPR-associated protein Cmr1
VIKINTGRAFQARNNQGQPVDIGATNSPYLYVAFPLQQSGGRVFEDVTFTLSVSLPSDDEALVEQVRAAFWAWDTFGGVGARTRRGFGALSCQMPRKAKYSAQFEPRDWHWEYDARRANTKLMADVRQLVVEGRGPADVPKLSRLVTRYKLTSLNPSEMAVWTYLFGALKAFRQSSQRQYGRSDWPDPQAIREATGQKSPQHANPVHNFLINKFPRARFGLPIIFEFKNGATDASARGVDPRKTMVSLAGRSRLASPLIIRPLAVSGGQFAGLALILDGNRIPPKQLELQEIDRTKIDDANHTLSEDEAREISRLHDTTITPDILQSFLDSLS